MLICFLFFFVYIISVLTKLSYAMQAPNLDFYTIISVELRKPRMHSARISTVQGSLVGGGGRTGGRGFDRL